MHEQSFFAMNAALTLYRADSARVLDVGSLNVNGSFRTMVEDRGWHYTGVDIQPGENVDIVSTDPYHYPFEEGEFDVVICGNALHNVAEFWRLIPELARILKPGGLLAIVTVHYWGEGNRYPQDYWRFLPDGLRYLFDMTGALERYDIRIITERDIVGTAWKVSNA